MCDTCACAFATHGMHGLLMSGGLNEYEFPVVHVYMLDGLTNHTHHSHACIHADYHQMYVECSILTVLFDP